MITRIPRSPILIALSILPLVAQQSPISEVESLRGQTKMSISITKRDGSDSIDYDNITAELQKVGILILPAGTYPQLQLTIDSVRSSNRCGALVTPAIALAVRLEFEQLMKVGNHLVVASTYTTNSVALAGGFGGAASMIAETAKSDLKEFLQDFKSVNQNLPSTKPKRPADQSPFDGEWTGFFRGCDDGASNMDDVRKVHYFISETPGLPGDFIAKENQVKFNYEYIYHGGQENDDSLLLTYNFTKLRLKMPVDNKNHLDGEFINNGRCRGVYLDRIE